MNDKSPPPPKGRGWGQVTHRQMPCWRELQRWCLAIDCYRQCEMIACCVGPRGHGHFDNDVIREMQWICGRHEQDWRQYYYSVTCTWNPWPLAARVNGSLPHHGKPVRTLNTDSDSSPCSVSVNIAYLTTSECSQLHAVGRIYNDRNFHDFDAFNFTNVVL